MVCARPFFIVGGLKHVCQALVYVSDWFRCYFLIKSERWAFFQALKAISATIMHRIVTA